MIGCKRCFAQASIRRHAAHRVPITACLHGRTPAVQQSRDPRLALHGCIKPPKQFYKNNGDALAPRKGRGRLPHLLVRASLPGDSSPGAPSSSFPSPYAPFSAELLLAVARLGHLERYRQEIAQFYEPGGTTDLTRCGLLISNIFSPQLDHRPCFEQLEEYVGRATLATLATFDHAEVLYDLDLGLLDSSINSSSSTSANLPTANLPVSTIPKAAGNNAISSSFNEHLDTFSGLDITQADHLLRAIAAINQVLFTEEGLTVNGADPYDPLNGSIADVLFTKRGNQYSLAMIYMHVADGLGLPCAAVGSAEHVLLRIGSPTITTSSSSSSSSSTGSSTGTAVPTGGACYLVDVANNGHIYAWPGKMNSSSHGQANSTSMADSSSTVDAAQAAALDPMDTVSADDINDDWHQKLHSWLQLQPGTSSSGSPVSAHHNDSTDMTLNTSNPADEASSILSDVADSEAGYVDSSLSDWQQVGGYSAADAATRNSWKALYGAGALAEWGGLVSSSSSNSSKQYPQYMQSGIAEQDIEDTVGSSELHQAAAAAGDTWFGIVDSPFAAAANTPFSDGTEDQHEGSLTAGESSSSSMAGNSPDSNESTNSMDTCRGSDTEGMQLTQEASNNGSPSSSSEHVVQAVSSLTAEDVCMKYGSLAPIRPRVLLQQLLAGMKLSLLMSGREEEALAVIRYLRATDPFSLPDLRDEALALANAQNYEGAAQLLREYLAVAPGAPDADMVGEVLQQVQLAAEVARARARKQQRDQLG